jgi:MoaA/NifB/PqqE/SkfB family radical SAM enzyme
MPVLAGSKPSDSLPPLVLPEGYNYIAVFLTLDCNLRCSYCINHFGGQTFEHSLLRRDDWVKGINRIVSRSDLPVTLQGGEPTLHPDFFSIVNGIRPDISIDLLTNLEIDARHFMREIDFERFRRDAPYASIRVSYHPESMKIQELAAKVLSFLEVGYSIGIWGVLHPEWESEIFRAMDYCLSLGIDFRTKEFLGEHAGVMHGVFTYPDVFDGGCGKSVSCRTTELIIGPDGGIYRCHSDLYSGRSSVGNILDPDLVITDSFRRCDYYGFCNPCDVKLKTNRFQTFGHTSVEIFFDEN